MAWTAPATAVTGDIIPASFWNTYGRDNLAYLKGLLDGTGSDSVILPGQLRVNGDSNFVVYKNAPYTIVQFDSGDDVLYDRTNNLYLFRVGGVVKWQLDGNGKQTGAGFYDSGEVSVSAGSTQGFSHGLGARPRFIAVYFGTAGSMNNIATPAFISVGATVRFSAVDTTTISVVNNHGSTWTVRVFAML